MAIAIENATIRIVTRISYNIVLTIQTNVGIEASIHILFALGSFHFVAEGYPIVSRADGEEVVGQLTQIVERRLVLIYIHLNIVCDAGTE